jgi:4-aminobutyrate aminotransferase-like enzyme
MIYNEGYAAEAQPRYIDRAEGCYLWDRSGRNS